MRSFIAQSIPRQRLRRLEFMLGEMSGLETLYPPGQPSVQFQAIHSGSWEECERFLKIDFYSDVPGIGTETYRALVTYSESKERYRMWAFCASEEEPLYMEGDFVGESLILMSNPWPMPWGLQKLRSTFTPMEGGGLAYAAELWEPDGYRKYCTLVLEPQPDGRISDLGS